MAKKIKKTIPWFIVLALIIVSTVFILNYSQESIPEKVSAGTATTSVVVGNTAPTISAAVEDPSSADG